MKPKTIIITLIVLALIGYLLILSYKKSASTTASVQGVQNTGAKSLLTTPDTFYNFGTISMKNNEVTKEFTVGNPTSKDITVATVLTSCMCTSAFIVEPDGTTKGPFKMPGMGYVPPADEIIKAGDSRVIRVVYDPNAHGPAGVGAIDRFVTLTDTDGGTLQLEIKALVTP